MKRVTFDDHLDDMLERLMNENLSEEELDIEIKRSRAMSKIIDHKIEDKRISLEFVKAVSNGLINEKMIPGVFVEDFKKIGKSE